MARRFHAWLLCLLLAMVCWPSRASATVPRVDDVELASPPASLLRQQLPAEGSKPAFAGPFDGPNETVGSDRLIRMSHTGEFGGPRFYHFDALGSVTALSDKDGNVPTRLHLDAWGVFKNPSELNTNNRFAFTGYVYSPLLNLYYAKARFYDPETARFTSQDDYLGKPDNPPSLHRYYYAASNPTRYVDRSGHDFSLNKDEKYGPNEVAAPVLSGTVSDADLKKWMAYVDKHGSQAQRVQAVLGGANVYTRAYGQGTAKIEAAGVAGVVAAAPVAIAGGGAVAVGAVGGATQGFVSGLLDKASAAEVATRTFIGGALGGALGWASEKLGALVWGEASPSTPGVSETSTTAPKPVSGEPVPHYSDAPSLSVPEQVNIWSDVDSVPLRQQPDIGGGSQALDDAAEQLGIDFNAAPASANNEAAATAPSNATGPSNASTRIQTTVGNLRSAELRDAHHIIQDAAVRDLPGYQTELAPGTQLQGPSNVRGTPHYEATQVQRQAGGGTYAAERRIAYKALREAGLTEAEARAEIDRADQYFQSIGVTPQTQTRIPGNRK